MEKKDQLDLTQEKNRLKLIDQFDKASQSTFFRQETIAAILCCSTALLERNRSDGKGIPYFKINWKCLYRKSDVLEWLEKQKKTNF